MFSPALMLRFHDLAPLRDLRAQRLCELVRRAWHRFGAVLEQALFHLRIVQRFDDIGVQLSRRSPSASPAGTTIPDQE
jgi:hypothetical protein